MKLWSKVEQSSKKGTKDNLSPSDRKLVIFSLIGVQGFLTVATYFAAISGQATIWQFFLGLNLLVFAGLIRVYTTGKKAKNQKLKQIQSLISTENKFSQGKERSYLM